MILLLGGYKYLQNTCMIELPKYINFVEKEHL